METMKPSYSHDSLTRLCSGVGRLCHEYRCVLSCERSCWIHSPPAANWHRQPADRPRRPQRTRADRGWVIKHSASPRIAPCLCFEVALEHLTKTSRGLIWLWVRGNAVSVLFWSKRKQTRQRSRSFSHCWELKDFKQWIYPDSFNFQY